MYEPKGMTCIIRLPNNVIVEGTVAKWDWASYMGVRVVVDGIEYVTDLSNVVFMTKEEQKEDSVVEWM